MASPIDAGTVCCELNVAIPPRISRSLHSSVKKNGLPPVLSRSRAAAVRADAGANCWVWQTNSAIASVSRPAEIQAPDAVEPVQFGQPGDELVGAVRFGGAERGHHQHADVGAADQHLFEHREGGQLRPMQVVEDQRDRAIDRQAPQEAGQRVEKGAPGRAVVLLPGRYRADADPPGLSAAAAVVPRPPARPPSNPVDRPISRRSSASANGAYGTSASAVELPTSTATSWSASVAATSAARRVLPAPGSPPMNTAWRLPLSTRSHACSNAASSAARPTSGPRRRAISSAGSGGGTHCAMLIKVTAPTLAGE